MPLRWWGLEARDLDAVEDPIAKRARKVFAARDNDLEAMAALLRSNRKHLSADIPLSNVTMPTPVPCGDEDRSPEPLAAALPNAKALVLGGDHEGVVSNPQLAKEVVRFVSG